MDRQQGFTLVEVLVALAVVAVVALLAHQMLKLVITGEERLAPRRRQLAALQIAMATIQRDLAQIADRPVRDGFGRPRPALVLGGAAVLEFTRAGRPNPMDRRQADLVRIGYRLRGRTLVREVWPVLDRVQSSAPIPVPLLDEVTDATARVRTDDGAWHAAVPDRRREAGTTDQPPRPVAIEVTLTIDRVGRVRRLVPVP